LCCGGRVSSNLVEDSAEVTPTIENTHNFIPTLRGQIYDDVVSKPTN